MRSIEEIKAFAATKGIGTEARDRGTSYRAGGDIICFPAGFDWSNGEFAVSITRRFGFEGADDFGDLEEVFSAIKL